MRTVFVSDLHLDIRDNELNYQDLPEADVLCVAGDTSNNVKFTARFIQDIAVKYSKVFVIDGNHEHYSNVGSGRRTIEDALKILEDNLPYNAHLLKPTQAIEFDGFSFLGCNSWYSMDYLGAVPEEMLGYWEDYMNDFRCTWNGIKQDWPYHMALESAKQLKLGILSANNPCVVLTHTLPHVDFLYHKPWDPHWEMAHSFFYNSHMQDILPEVAHKIAIFHFGHTHCSFYKKVEDIQFICNPRGYPGEVSSWMPVVIDL